MQIGRLSISDVPEETGNDPRLSLAGSIIG